MKKKFVSLSIFNLIILIENNPAFYQLLKEKFQHVCNLIVIHGSAVDVPNISVKLSFYWI